MARVVNVMLWGAQVGAATWDDRGVAAFEYTDVILNSGVELSPIVMPLARTIYQFPSHKNTSFSGLPGLLADALPDRFGHAVIDAHLARRGLSREAFSPLDRLLYVGRRAMGALEFEPAYQAPEADGDDEIQLSELVAMANRVLDDREEFRGALGETGADAGRMEHILQMSASAGGARAKALIGWSPTTGEVRSAQIDLAPGFEHWLIKFDGVSGNRDRESVDDPMGYGLIEYAYYLMATAASIDMTHCRVLAEAPRRHFMTRRFDRTEDNQKLHMQSLCGLYHLDYNLAGAHSYEQAFSAIRKICLAPMDDMLRLFRRMVFNVRAYNRDDHTKNIAFLMNKQGTWSLSPAYDVTHAYNPSGSWTHKHQMSINGRRDGIGDDEFLAVAKRFAIPTNAARHIIGDVEKAISQWPRFAREAGVGEGAAAHIARLIG